MKFVTTFIFALCAWAGLAQSTIYDTISHGGLDRAYILYVPASYSAGTPAPLLFNFHGYTSSSFEQMWYGDFRDIADTAGFIIAHPMGTPDGSAEPHWNIGFSGGTPDDVDFVDKLIDTIAADYDLDPDKMYTCGMSNGGFFSYRLGCELGHRFAAIASVTGSIVPSTLGTCNTTHPMPMMQIHGTADAVVPYTGGAGWAEPIDDIMTTWASTLNTTVGPTVTTMPDIDPLDGSTVEKHEYLLGDSCVDAIHYKVIGGGHTWPGTAIPMAGVNYDIDASVEIWNFFRQYDINGKIDCVTSVSDHEKPQLVVYPNPVKRILVVSADKLTTDKYQILSLQGKLVSSGTLENNRINVADLSKGIYILSIGESSVRFNKE